MVVGSALVGLVAIYVHKTMNAAAKPTGATTAKQPTAGPPLTGKKRLRVMTMWNQPYRDNFSAILAEYGALHPELELVQEAVPASGTGNLQDMMKMQLEAGEPPDLFLTAAGEWSGPFIDAGHMIALDQAYASHGWHETLIPWAVNAVMRHGRYWGVPIATRAIGFWFRKDLFAKYNLSPPRTYAELETICRIFREHDTSCLALGGKFGWNVMRLLDFFIETAVGPQGHDQLNRFERRWDTPEVEKAFSLLKKWVDEKWLPPGFLMLSPNDARLPFYRGLSPMILDGDWIEAVMRDDEQPGGRFDFFVTPTGWTPQRFQAFPQQLMIPVLSRHKDEAIEFLHWYISLPIQSKHFEKVSLSTATRGVKPNAARWPHQTRWREILDSAETYPPSDQIFNAELMDTWFAVQDGLIAGGVTVQEAGVQMQAAMQKYLAAPKAPPTTPAKEVRP